MKRILLAAAATVVLASPAYAGCTEDVQAQAQKVLTITQGLGAKATASKDEQCSAMKDILAESKKLTDIYKTCQAELKLTDEQLQKLDQNATMSDQGYAAQCGG